MKVLHFSTAAPLSATRRTFRAPFTQGIIAKQNPPVPKAAWLAQQIGEFARLVFLAADRPTQHKLIAVHRAIIQAIFEIRNDFNIKDSYWQEWESAHVKKDEAGALEINGDLLWFWDPDALKWLGIDPPPDPPNDSEPLARKKPKTQATRKKPSKRAHRRRASV